MNAAAIESRPVPVALADHEVRIEQLERSDRAVTAKLDRLQWWIMCVLATSLGTLVLFVLGLLFRKS